MPGDTQPQPRSYYGVCVSSTFRDLEQHRAALIHAIDGQDLKPVAMEFDGARADADVIESSLKFVRDAAAYIGVIGLRYGQTPQDPKRNPQGLSITELEFDEAQRLGRPILLFIMSEQHKVLLADIELDPIKREKLNAFRERAKRMSADSSVERVYATFDSPEDFEKQAIKAVARLRTYLEESAAPASQSQSTSRIAAEPDSIPRPPAFYAEPPYIGSHPFVGRQAQLDILDDWAAASDPYPVLLFDAIGGSGKSLLTWEWVNHHAMKVRQDWAGRFWYSFYERGAQMADFCRRALAYMTGRPMEELYKLKTLELSDQLLHLLRARPWLLVLDGLERVLVAYHRLDAAQLSDEQADNPEDQIAKRDPCAAIRPEDDDLLRLLAAAGPSKLLITSRLVPKVLLNPAGQPIPGVRRLPLPGLRPADAEAMVRACGVQGGSQAIQDYLKAHCDCHPLVCGILAGLVCDYLPAPGDFDAWVEAADGGARLDLARLDLVQKRNHILRFALDSLPPAGRQLLSTLALISEAVDYPTLSAFNPHLSPKPEEVTEPEKPEVGRIWDRLFNPQRWKERQEYKARLARYQAYQRALRAWRELRDREATRAGLEQTVRDLQRRGLLQYDMASKHYDLHPVVRGIAAGGLAPEDKERYGQRVVDHFSARPPDYDHAETLEDLRAGIQVLRTLLELGRYSQGSAVYWGAFAQALFFRLEAYAEMLALLRPFFPHGWTVPPAGLSRNYQAYLANEAGLALLHLGELEEALAAFSADLRIDLEEGNWQGFSTSLGNIADVLDDLNRPAQQERCLRFSLDLAALGAHEEERFVAQLYWFGYLVQMDRLVEAEQVWESFDPRNSQWFPGGSWSLETNYVDLQRKKGDLTEAQLATSEQLAQKGTNRFWVRRFHTLCGAWRLKRSEWALAEQSLEQAVQMARAAGIFDPESETLLALARLRLGDLNDPRGAAEELSQARDPAHGPLAELWLAIGEPEQARLHALAFYTWAWADGLPYVRRYELEQARALLQRLNTPIPGLPPYDSTRDEKFPWEDDLAAAIEKLRAEKQAKDEASLPSEPSSDR